MEEFDALVALMDRLRGPNGCPWDREQTPRDLRGYLLEEAYEVVESIDAGEPGPLCEELGDLLFQIVFLARIGAETGSFTIRDVARRITEKMTRRHPHVFGDASARTPAEVLRQWEEIKRREKGEAHQGGPEPSALDGIPRSLPGLARAERMGEKASRLGLDWSRPEEVLEKVEEEVRELRRALDHEPPERVSEEFGDALFALANLARHLGVHAEAALQAANEKFGSRFRRIEPDLRALGPEAARETPEALDRLWRRAKAD